MNQNLSQQQFPFGLKAKHKDKQSSVWGDKKLGGYAGLTHTADKINKYIPTSKIYVEPFAGLGRTVQLRHDKIVVNDLSDYAVDYLKNNYGEQVVVTQEDFISCIKRWDSKDTFFLIDPPWRYTLYNLNDRAFCDRKPIQYYSELLSMVSDLLGDWMICSAKDEHEIKKCLTKSEWNCQVVQSDKKVIFGKYATTLLCSNLFSTER